MAGFDYRTALTFHLTTMSTLPEKSPKEETNLCSFDVA